MKDIPVAIMHKYNDQLLQNEVDPKLHSIYRKWLRFYLDFCEKYDFRNNDAKSLPFFLQKLRDKKQHEEQLKEARSAISLHYAIKRNQKDVSPVIKQGKEVPNGKGNANKKVAESPWQETLSKLAAEIQMRHYSPKTLKAYSIWIKKYEHFLRSKDPYSLTSENVRSFLSDLAVNKHVSASTQNQAFNALLFFHRHIIKRDFGELKDVVRAKRKPYIPVVLSKEEVHLVIGNLQYPYSLIVKLLYGCGLRLGETVQLRLNNFNFDGSVLTIHDGKGKKDRTVPLPVTVMPELQEHMKRVIELHQADLDFGYAGVFMMGQLDKKYINCGKELPWQWAFPAKTLTLTPDTHEYKRYHLHETHIQKE